MNEILDNKKYLNMYFQEILIFETFTKNKYKTGTNEINKGKQKYLNILNKQPGTIKRIIMLN